MKPATADEPRLAPGAIRIDRLLVYLRFARTRSTARAMIESRALRRNRKHVLRPSENAHIGDVLTVVVGQEVRVIELVTLPDRRASPAVARSHYRVVGPVQPGGERHDHLDPAEQFAIAATPCAAATRPTDPLDPQDLIVKEPQ